MIYVSLSKFLTPSLEKVSIVTLYVGFDSF